MRQVKYTVIAKVETSKFVKYRTTDLLSFTKYLDTSFPDWRYFNVYDKKSKEQIANFTKKNRPITKQINQ